MSPTVARLESIFTTALAVEAPGATVDLIDGGYLDSLAVVELLAATELEFGIEIPLHEVDIDRVRTLDRLAGLVDERLALRSTDAA